MVEGAGLNWGMSGAELWNGRGLIMEWVGLNCGVGGAFWAGSQMCM